MGTISPLLEVVGISKVFGALAAIDGLSFSVDEGEVLGIGGPNGAGKTTLFDAISGLTSASGGRILLEGRDIARLSAHKICHLGIARTFQLNAAFGNLTVRENVTAAAYFGRTRRLLPGLRVERTTRRRVDETLEFLGMRDREDEIVGDMSVMHKKLLMIGGALCTDPKILLMDEPVGGLTPEEIDRMTDIVQEIRKRRVTIVVIEHVMRFLTGVSDRIMIMHHGQKIYYGDVEGMRRDRTVVDVYLGSSVGRTPAVGQPT